MPLILPSNAAIFPSYSVALIAAKARYGDCWFQDCKIEPLHPGSATTTIAQRWIVIKLRPATPPLL